MGSGVKNGVRSDFLFQKIRPDTIFHIFIISFWVSMMGLLVVKEFLPENIPPQEIRFPKELPYTKDWGIYTNTGRIGYLKTELASQQMGYQWRNKVEIRLLRDTPISINSTAMFNRDGRLEDFYMDLTYEDLVVNLIGVVNGASLKLIVGQKEYTMPWYANSDIMSNGIIPWFYISGLKVGDKFQWYLLNPLTQKRDLVKAVVRRSSFYYNKKDFSPVTVVDLYYQDTKLEFWVDSEGNPLKVITPWGWELAAE